MELRKVQVNKYASVPVEGGGRNARQLQPAGEAMFHQFGVNFVEFDSGPGNFTTAVIEWPDGQIENIPVDQIKFVTPTTL